MTNFRKACMRFAGSLALILTAAAALPPALSRAQNSPAQRPPSLKSRILFQSTQGSEGWVNEIYTMDEDGKHQVRLTYNDVDDASPIWSPQGDRIAFLSFRNDLGYDIYLMNPDGSGERPLRDAEHGGPLLTNNIQWSPDGKKIMFAVGGKISVVEVIAADGSYSTAPVENLSANAPDYAYDSAPRWSPDGSMIAFTSKGCAECFPDIFVINADGTGRTQVTNTPNVEYDPRWTPTGRIAYGVFLDDMSTNTYVSNPDGTGEQPLTDVVPQALNPVWSPDGTRVIFGSAGPAGSTLGGIYTMNVDGTGLTFLTGEANGGGLWLWSPDGNSIVAHIINDLNAIDVICFNANGTNRRVVNMTKTRKADEYAWSWQRLPTP